MEDYKIYPKQFQFDIVSVERNKCFMIMPFNEEYRRIYGIIKDELNANNIVCNRADEIKGSRPIMNKIIKGILKSRYIIAELTESNANVFYELGIAHSFRDSRNILLIKQRTSKYPFDLSHLQYTEYDPENEFYLRDIVKSFIKECQYTADFEDAVQLHNIPIYLIDKRFNYIEFIQDYLESNIEIYTNILNGKSSVYKDEEIDNAFLTFNSLINTALIEQPIEIVRGVLKIYILLLVSCSSLEISRKYAVEFSTLLSQSRSKFEEEYLPWETDLMIELAQHKKLFDVCMPWIIEYFSKLQATTIDLNRYKLERFLMTSPYEEVNEYMIDALYSTNSHIRETMANIIGEKRLNRALGVLYNRLDTEQNNYVSRSLVEAIGKIDDISNVERLLLWFENKREKFEQDKYYGIYNHMTYALQKMDSSSDKKYFIDFTQKYKERINIPGIN